MSGQIVINPELVFESISRFTRIRQTDPVDTQSGNSAYSRTFKQVAPRSVKLLSIDLDRETDGRWIAEVPEIPGVMVYGCSRDHAVAEIKKLAFSVLADDPDDSRGTFDVRYTFLIEHAA